LHCDFACLLYGMLTHKLSQDVLETIVKDAVEIEKAFICDAIPCALIGMNSGMMSTYIEYCADRLLQTLGSRKIYNVQNPFDWSVFNSAALLGDPVAPPRVAVAHRRRCHSRPMRGVHK
jgi:ribonucleotide reductase beta subunit family protein with ferritin-like domain